MYNKRGANLGIKEIVGIVLALAFMALAITTMVHFHGKGEKAFLGNVESIMTDSQRATLELGLEGKSFLISDSDVKVKVGESKTIIAGVRNTFGYEDYFLEVKILKGDMVDDWFLYVEDIGGLNVNEQYLAPIKITAPQEASSGSQIVEISLWHEADRLGSEQIIVSVE